MMRTTSVYTLTVPGQPELLDGMVAACPETVVESLVSEGSAKLRFRTTGDEAARMTVLMIFSAMGLEPTYRLHTGVGVNVRAVALSASEE